MQRQRRNVNTRTPTNHRPLPENETRKAAEQTNRANKPPSTECKNKVTIGINTDENENPRSENQEKNKEDDNISRKRVIRYVHATLKVMKAANTKEDMITKICIILQKLMATMDNTAPESEINSQAGDAIQDGNTPNHG